MQLKPYELKNYRQNQFYLLKTNVVIAGIAGPHNHDNIDTVLMHLKEHEKISVIIGLHESEDFTKQAQDLKLEYHWLPMKDFGVHEPGIFDHIYSIIEKAIETNKQVVIHCGSGNGRTGTALATLKIRELLENMIAKESPSLLEEKPKNSMQIYTCLGYKDKEEEDDTIFSLEEPVSQDIPCTPLVKNAVEAIRTQKKTQSLGEKNGSESVETANDVTTLINYEIHLRASLNMVLKKKATNSLGAENIASAFVDAPVNKLGWFGEPMKLLSDDDQNRHASITRAP